MFPGLIIASVVLDLPLQIFAQSWFKWKDFFCISAVTAFFESVY